MSGENEWNGHPIPPRPPLPASGQQGGPQRPPAPPVAQAESTGPQTAVRRIGMPPGMEPSLDTVPSTDHAAPIPVARPEFGVAPTPFAPAAATGAPVTAPAPVATPNNPRLILPDGSVLALANGLIVGRDPQEQDGYGVSALAALHDVERSVSKTHAVLGVSEGRVWVIDLNSTNGTVLVASDGSETLCTPEVATPLPAKTDLRFGEFRVRVAFD